MALWCGAGDCAGGGLGWMGIARFRWLSGRGRAVAPRPQPVLSPLKGCGGLIGWGGEVIREWACRSEYWFEWVNNRQTLPRECVKLQRNNLVKLSCLGVDFLPRIVI